ncbi:hypothetical protein [Algoriphagus sp.]|jgi:hypothetical protein|uniref:hypothetical protein n=1 Tax=Algoriphagus sp. TaxID=1872435 RepID=UPI00271D4302|nr:hypothetical protein [Algoriphagus sp.]MDO8966929.1 hypothetical protein [Algoriphagus sp.]MDP3199747.1 hypothetical protein [Algoriphagus sp.]
MKTIYFLAIFLGTSLSVFAQFPTFYPTYKNDYTLKKNEEFVTEKLKAAAISLLDSIGKDSLSFHVRSAPDMVGVLKRMNDRLKLKVDSLELEVKSAYINKIPTVEEVKEVVNWKEAILKNTNEIDKNNILIDYFGSINSFLGKPVMATRFFPVKNRNQGDFFYNNVTSSGVSTLNSFVIQASGNGGVANTEIVSGRISALRVSFSSVIQGGGDSSDSLEVNTKLFNGGGITNLHLEYPFFYYNRQNVLFYSAFKPGFVADLPVFGSQLERDAFSGYADLAMEFLTEIRTDGGEFSLFANFKGSYITGTPTFYSTLKAPDTDLESKKVDKPFWISQVYVGISVSKQFRVSANIPIATTRQIALPDKIQIGIQILTNSNK